MQEHFFDTCGISYRTNELKTGRPTLVFIHGLSGSSSAWLPYESSFDHDYNVITLDLRGHGRSRKLRYYRDYALDLVADDVYALLTYLHIETCTLVSHSYGTLVALELLQAHPEMISRTLFLSPTAFLHDTRWYWFIKIFGVVLNALFRLFPFHPTIRGRVDYSPFHHTSDWDLRRVWGDLNMTTLHIYLYCLLHAYRKNYNSLWREVRVPTVIMHGTADSYIPVKHSVRLAKEIAGSKLVILQGANHILVLNNILEISEQVTSLTGGGERL